MNAAERQKIWESHKKHIELLAKVNNSYVYVVDNRKKRYIYMSGNLQHFLSADMDGLIQSHSEGEDFLAARIHPEDWQMQFIGSYWSLFLINPLKSEKILNI